MPDAPPDGKWPRLLSLAVHEFRTPISVVAGYIRMVLKDPAGTLDERYRRMLQEAEKSCGRLTGLVAEMSELSHLEAQDEPLRKAAIDLHALLGDAIAGLPELPDRSVAIELRASSPPVMIQGDATRLRLALSSILYGLRREIVSGDRLLVSERTGTWQARPASWIAIAEPPQIDALVDAPAESLTTFDEWRGGCGLSLPVARRNINAHGGAVWSPLTGPKGAAVIVLPH